MAAKLDRSRPFGEVYGPGNVRFIQDDKEFDVFGQEVIATESPVVEPVVAEKPKRGRKKADGVAT